MCWISSQSCLLYTSRCVEETVAELAAASDPAFAVNTEYLRKAQPKDLDASEIDVRLGATWVNQDYIQQFMEETFEPPFYLRRNIEVKFSPMKMCIRDRCSCGAVKWGKSAAFWAWCWAHCWET